MKKYISPAMLTVQLASRDAMMSVSATGTLTGTRYGGNTGTTITDADVKTTSDVNLWDNEW